MIKTWRTTDNGLELLLKKFCDTLLVLDEMQAGEPDTVARAAHLIAGETGKTTMTQDRTAREVAKWRIAAISTAENPVSKVLDAAKMGAQAGQLVRFVDIPAIATPDYGVFEYIGAFAGPGDFAEYVKSSALSAYGTAGPALVEAVVADIEAVKAAIKFDQSEFLARVLPKGADGQVERMSKSFALAATAGRLAARFGIAPWTEVDALLAAEVCFHAMLEGRGHAGSHELVSRLDAVRNNLMKRLKSKFIEWDNVVKGDLSTRGELGYIKIGKSKSKGKDEGLYVRLWMFKSEICAGFDHKPVLDELLKQGHVIPSNSGPSTVQRDPFDDKPERFYRFRLDFLKSSDGDVDTDIAD
jgi:putative DNA primase/helicase